MDDEPKSAADLRAFRWRAEPLLRKLHVEREVTRQRFAAARRDARARRKAAQDRDIARQAALARAAAGATGPLDPAALSRTLAHVMRIAGQAADARIEAQACEHRADLARSAWLVVESRLSWMQNLRRAAQAEYASEQLRRVAKEADQLWLAQRRAK